MHVLQLANFYHAASGGLRTAVDHLAGGYQAAGHDVSLVVPASGRRERVVDGRRVIEVRAPRVPGAPGYRAIVDRRAVAGLIRELRPDVIELSDRTTLAQIVTGLHDRPPVVLFSHERLDLAASKRLARADRLVDAWTRRLVSRVDVTVCASAFAAAEFDGVTDEPIVRIPLGVDLQRFRPQADDEPPVATPRQWSPGSHQRAVFVGRLSPEKHADAAIAAVDRLVRSGRLTELLIVGDGPERLRLERMAAGLPVRFAGHVADRDTVAAILRRADVAICPSPVETFGLAALEAMACGTPVAATAAGAIAELVVADAGAVGEPGPNGLAGAMASLLESDRAVQRIAARRRAEQFSWDTTVREMLAVHEKVAAADRFAAVS